MLQFNRRFARSLAVPLAALAFTATASTSAFAWPHLPFLHRHRTLAQPDPRVTVHLYNSNDGIRQIMVNDRVFTMNPHHVLSIKGPVGTNVYAQSAGRLHQRGEVLFAIAPQLDEKTLSINAIN
jgi:hypothetical protein